MGWARGSEVMGRIMDAARKHIPDDKARQAFYLEVIHALEDCDWDTQNECEGEDDAFDKALREANPDWDEDGL